MPENYNDNNNLDKNDLLSNDNYSRKDSSDDIIGSKSSEVRFNSDSNSGSYSYTSENSKKKCNKNIHLLMKGAAAVLAVIILGAGTVQIYKFLSDTREELVELSGDPSAKSVSKEIEQTDKKIEELPSLIELASRTDAKPLPDIVDSIMPSVVGVASTFEFEQQQSFSMWGWNTQPVMRQAIATGTGFIISEDGYIVTNSHVVYDTQYNAGKAIEVSVLFSDETEHEANIVAFDPDTDIAVLKVNEKGLKPAVLGDSDELRVGELVIAVGNPLGFDLFGTVTSGIVSALNRKIDINEKKMNLIQTDAAINSGNSGGPLLNSCGQVIGINSAKMSSSYSSSSASVEGLCFAIPMKEAKVIIDDLINYRYVTGRPQIGINTTDIDEIQARFYNIPMGVLVRAIQEGSAADLAGLKVGDVIIDIEGETVTTAKEFNEVKNKYKAGDVITLTVSRDGRDVKIKVTLQEQKAIIDNPKEGT
ncbi:S1C family serine protease [Ruminococcus flavefaciens]|uniref:Serine protease Do n=1 Tax=Ruminococcus flavefaciens TaxID=1265 RepID=A0A1M7HDM8_RUMFL|nr:trypsin-like peptidase domain-containing protein [Ruminococcus flavefaciens]SHM26528.1 serine protease Do [Ruminococcus flavefaciens]